MTSDWCPNCGTARTGSFRFCRSCGFDYDPAQAVAPTAAPTVLGEVSGPGPGPEAEAVPTPTAAEAATPARPASDVVVIPKRHLRRLAGLVIGGLVGAMLAGAVVVPFLGDGLIVLGTVATIVMVVGLAWLGLRIATSGETPPA